jgi:hypothetical protein
VDSRHSNDDDDDDDDDDDVDDDNNSKNLMSCFRHNHRYVQEEKIFLLSLQFN